VAARPRPSPIGAFLSRAWPPLAKLSARRAGNPAHRGADIVWVFWQTRAAVVRPINPRPAQSPIRPCGSALRSQQRARQHRPAGLQRSEEHTSELQSLRHLVCRLLLEKKKKKKKYTTPR